MISLARGDRQPVGSDPTEILAAVDHARLSAFGALDAGRRSQLGQFPTPMTVATYMASLFRGLPDRMRLLDAGAGVGTLTAAVIAAACSASPTPVSIDATAFEIEPLLSNPLRSTLTHCEYLCRSHHVAFAGSICTEDFIVAATDMLRGGLWHSMRPQFNCVILNPPYKKISSDSKHRRLLSEAGIETSNLYTAFLALAIMLLEPEGQIVAITPRSFCNGPYFEPFRRLLLRELSLRHIHVFESRSTAFAEDAVLQENIIFHGIKARRQESTVQISLSNGPTQVPSTRTVCFDEIVRPHDPNQFIHIPACEHGSRATELVLRLPCTLDDLGLTVSTGRVVDFRCRQWLVKEPTARTVPLIYPAHFSNGSIAWPRQEFRKANAYLVTDESSKWLVPAGRYVLTRRFSAKEETRRIRAALFDPRAVPCDWVAFENHLNYFHENGRGLSADLANGLTAFLNSKVVDDCFRQFNGHTQVNASDLRRLRYPTRRELEEIGARLTGQTEPSGALDSLIETEMAEWAAGRANQER